MEAINDSDRKMVQEVKDISRHGNHAEVKRDKDGNWVVYEVQKKKKKVG